MKALIVDDERLARLELRRLLGEGHPDVEIVAEAGSVGEARRQMEDAHPELLFLDVQLRGETGFDLLQALTDEGAVRLPKVIFTTAHDAYALRAFEFQAFDYLLKPIVPARLAASLARLERMDAPSVNPSPEAGPDPLPDVRLLGEDDQVFLREGDQCFLVKVRDLRLLETEVDGCRVHLASGARLLLIRPLQELEARLDNRWFFRANRQQIVNLRWVQRIEPWFSGGLLAVLPDGVRVELSRRQAQRFKERMSL